MSSALLQTEKVLPIDSFREEASGLAWLGLPRLPQWAAVAGVVLTSAVGLLLTARLALGALTADLPIGLSAMVAAVGTCVAVFARRAFDDPEEPAWAVRCAAYGGSLGLALLAVCCCSGMGILDCLIWTPLLVADQFSRQHYLDRIPGALEELLGDDCESLIGEEELRAFGVETLASEEELIDPPATVDDGMMQQLYRVREADGRECVYATVGVEFAAEQRSGTAFVAFCPPLPRTPEVEADPLNFPEARIGKVTAYPHGAQIEVKLSQPAEDACRVLIDLAAG
ncbi:MAG: hypothetical protein AAGA92_04025 [Planctomycetota bacterium]